MNTPTTANAPANDEPSRSTPSRSLELFRLFQDGMVIQRDRDVPVWGWASPGSRIEVDFLGKRYETDADGTGAWEISLESASAGGPHEMRVRATGGAADANADDEIAVSDILVGDVFLGSGQSNMELPLSRTLDLFADEVRKIDNPKIRQFRVPIAYDFNGPQAQLSDGAWVRATGDAVPSLSATGYFFAQALFARTGVPVGVVNSGVGGSPIEAWLPASRLRALGGYDEDLDRCKDGAYVRGIQTSEQARQDAWYARLNREDAGRASTAWSSPDLDDGSWPRVSLPFYFRDFPPLSGLQGSAWFRKTVEIPAGARLDGIDLQLGAMIDGDEVFVNGELVGATAYMYPPRRYHLPPSVLRHGKNLIAIRLVVNRLSGGFVAGKRYRLFGAGWEIDLAGEWRYAIGARLPELPQTTFFQYKPAGLFNAMLSPLAPFAFAGVLWYQGESNGYDPERYAGLFRDLICDWRASLRAPLGGVLPFLFVQLPNFEDPTKCIPPGTWPRLRAAQRSALSLPNTAMAVTIDSGEATDLHPQNKKAVGERLARAARALVLGERVEWSGPVPETVAPRPLSPASPSEGSPFALVVAFSRAEGGLVLKNDPPRYFELAGTDGAFHPATVSLESPSSLVLSSRAVPRPQTVRYAWLNNPENPDLFNRDGLPASPFEVSLTQ